MKQWAVGLVVAWASVAAAAEGKPFAIEVVDAQTGRGVPLVELRTVSNVSYFTDSAGLVAIDDPALMGRTVFFHVASHGYEIEPDGFGMRGRRIEVKRDAAARVEIKRINLAERLYRVTGEGVYRDSVVLGRKIPLRNGLLVAQVTGQDSVQAAVYHQKLYWFWGDTNRQRYPLGHFGTAAATSSLPSRGGLDPSVGVDLDYFVDDEGFSRPVFQKEGNHPIWLDGLFVLKDDRGVERLVGKAMVMESLQKTVARRLVVFDDQADRFDTLKEIPLDAPLYPEGHPIRVNVGGVDYVYCGTVFPNVRFKADWKSFQDLSTYESFTCLTPGSRTTPGAEPPVERDAAGKPVWAWKRDTAHLGTAELIKLVDSKAFSPDAAWPLTYDADTKQRIMLSLASVQYNAFRKKYVGIGVQLGGKSSMLGEVYYAEAERPEGPWPWAKKIVTHDRYSFYNPVQHPFFEQEGGRLIYFEGTYATTFSRPDREATPRYDYNQVMYRLDLSDPRLRLPTEPPPSR
jgi:hypothetical protein